MRHKNKQSGFTLIELLVVIGIIGVLASVIGLALQNARARARDAKRAGDIKQVFTALEQYKIAHGVYPTGTASVASSGPGVVFNDPTAVDGSPEPFTPNYIPFMPTAPDPADGDCLSDPGRGSNNYWYEVTDDGIDYTLTFCLGKDTGQYPPGIHFSSGNGIQ